MGMSAVATFDPLQATDRFYTMVKSLNEFDKMEVRGVIETLLSTSGRERCFIGTYHRATANIATLLELKQPKHFQAIAMLARGLFELAVDIRLIDVIPEGPTKIMEFTDVEKLRCARNVSLEVGYVSPKPSAAYLNASVILIASSIRATASLSNLP
jgi:hypothetical protein